MVSTSARNAGGPWFDSRSRHDRLFYANSIYIYIDFHAPVTRVTCLVRHEK